MLEILKKYVYHWFKSLDINYRISIAEQYINETGFREYIVEAPTEHSDQWLIQNYSDELKDWIILNNCSR